MNLKTLIMVVGASAVGGYIAGFYACKRRTIEALLEVIIEMESQQTEDKAE